MKVWDVHIMQHFLYMYILIVFLILELQIGFSEESFVGTEAEGSVTMTITKSVRIANPVTVTVESFTVAGATAAGHALPPNLPPNNNLFSPNRARRTCCTGICTCSLYVRITCIDICTLFN